MKNDKLSVFISRLQKLGIETTYAGNIPWIYLDTICGKKVTERFQANHGFTVGYLGNMGFTFSDIKEIFSLLRKYL